MAEHDDASKTEEPTQRRLDQGRDRGQVAVSQEVKSAAILLIGAVGLMLLAPPLVREIAVATRPFLEMPHAFRLEAENLQPALIDLLLSIATTAAPFTALIVLAAIGSSVAQSGLIWSPEKVKPDLEKISPVKGAERMVSMRALVEFAKGIVKLAAVAALSFGLALPLTEDLELQPAISIREGLERLHWIAVTLTAGAAGVMVVVALLDFLYQRHAFLKQMRMTRQELNDEYKQAEGDPHVKARIRKLRTERAQRRMMANVPDADVVITNPTHFAVALAYKMEAMSAPKVVAKGADHMARRIREVAEENDVPLVENPPLARALYSSVELDDEIPAEHYQAVAQVIGYVMRLKGKVS